MAATPSGGGVPGEDHNPTVVTQMTGRRGATSAASWSGLSGGLFCLDPAFRYTEPLPLPLPLRVTATAGLLGCLLLALVWMALTYLRNGASDWPFWGFFFWLI